MLELLGNLGEFIGGIAVVVTIGYLAVQMRSQTIANRRSTFQDLLNHQAALNFAWMTNPELCDVFTGTMEDDLEDMDNKTRTLVTTQTTMALRQGQNAYGQYLEKAITKEQLSQLEMPLQGMMRRPYAMQLWSFIKANFPVEFQEYMEEVVIPAGKATYENWANATGSMQFQNDGESVSKEPPV
jgi:hypothetical protein